jgi:hypothetical protein
MITGKAYKRINILRKFKFILDRKTLEKIYFTFVRPLIECADVIWDLKIYLILENTSRFEWMDLL